MGDVYWKLLGIEPTKDVTSIKRAYASRAKKIDKELNPDSFRILHEAYKRALDYAKGNTRSRVVIIPNNVVNDADDVTSSKTTTQSPEPKKPEPQQPPKTTEVELQKSSFNFDNININADVKKPKSQQPPKTTEVEQKKASFNFDKFNINIAKELEATKSDAEIIFDEIIKYRTVNFLDRKSYVNSMDFDMRKRHTYMLLRLYSNLAKVTNDEEVWDSFASELVISTVIRNESFREVWRTDFIDKPRHIAKINEICNKVDAIELEAQAEYLAEAKDKKRARTLAIVGVASLILWAFFAGVGLTVGLSSVSGIVLNVIAIALFITWVYCVFKWFRVRKEIKSKWQS
ncbi:MAG: J domain-containing protein [Clostridia bacterium]|nr:J domain-containing protein [Clostridia bacterium]